MTIVVSKEAAKVIERMDRNAKQRIKAAILKLPQGDIKRLKGSAASFRLRVGDWRILFSHLEQDKILIEKVGPRGEIYKGV